MSAEWTPSAEAVEAAAVPICRDFRHGKRVTVPCVGCTGVARAALLAASPVLVAEALIDAADAIQGLHPGEVKNSVTFLRARAESVTDAMAEKDDEVARLRKRLRSKHCGCGWCCQSTDPVSRGPAHHVCRDSLKPPPGGSLSTMQDPYRTTEGTDR